MTIRQFKTEAESRERARQFAQSTMSNVLGEIYTADTEAEAAAALRNGIVRIIQQPMQGASAEGMALEMLPYLIQALSSPLHMVGSVPGLLLQGASVEYWGGDDEQPEAAHKCPSCGKMQAAPLTRGKTTLKFPNALVVAEIEMCDRCNQDADEDKFKALHIVTGLLKDVANRSPEFDELPF